MTSELRTFMKIRGLKVRTLKGRIAIIKAKENMQFMFIDQVRTMLKDLEKEHSNMQEALSLALEELHDLTGR